MRVIDTLPEFIGLPLKGLITVTLVLLGFAFGAGTVWTVVTVGHWLYITLTPVIVWSILLAIATYVFLCWVGDASWKR